jgi:hypothetical protein
VQIIVTYHYGRLFLIWICRSKGLWLFGRFLIGGLLKPLFGGKKVRQDIKIWAFLDFIVSMIR